MPSQSPSRLKSQRKMFPGQDMHYISNFSIGYQGVNFTKSSEYNNRFKYDAGKAIVALENSGPSYKRRISDIRNFNAIEAPKVPSYPAVSSRDTGPDNANRPPPYYPESVPPLDEAPLSVDRKVDPVHLIDEQTRPREEPALQQPALQPQPQADAPGYDPNQKVDEYIGGPQYEPEPQMEPPMQAPAQAEPAPVAREPTKEPRGYAAAAPEGEDLWNRILKHDGKNSESAQDKASQRKVAAAQAYKEELDRQLQYKKQKKEAAQTARKQEQQIARDWQDEVTKQDRAKVTETRRAQEQARQFYEKQIHEKTGSRSERKIQSRSSMPPPVQPRDNAAEEKQSIMSSRRKAMEELERIEREKERVKQEILMKDVTAPKPAVDSMAFAYDQNRDRFKQVRDFAYKLGVEIAQRKQAAGRDIPRVHESHVPRGGLRRRPAGERGQSRPRPAAHAC